MTFRLKYEISTKSVVSSSDKIALEKFVAIGKAVFRSAAKG